MALLKEEYAPLDNEALLEDYDIHIPSKNRSWLSQHWRDVALAVLLAIIAVLAFSSFWARSEPCYGETSYSTVIPSLSVMKNTKSM